LRYKVVVIKRNWDTKIKRLNFKDKKIQ